MIIEHIVEPTKLLLTWRSPEAQYHPRYMIAELMRRDDEMTLTYLTDTKDFKAAQAKGFSSYPAFPDIHKTYDNVMDAFMRRLPPRSRGDFSQYLESLRLKPDAELSNFALLGYSGAKLPMDGFSIVNPFEHVVGPCELLLEAAGFRFIPHHQPVEIKMGDAAYFAAEFNEDIQEMAIRITVNDVHVGYVNRALIPTFQQWMDAGRLAGAWVEKVKETSEKPTLYLFVKVI